MVLMTTDLKKIAWNAARTTGNPVHAQERLVKANDRFYARDVKVVKTHLTSETLKPSGIKTGRIKVDNLTKKKLFLKKTGFYPRTTLETSKLGAK